MHLDFYYELTLHWCVCSFFFCIDKIGKQSCSQKEEFISSHQNSSQWYVCDSSRETEEADLSHPKLGTKRIVNECYH